MGVDFVSSHSSKYESTQMRKLEYTENMTKPDFRAFKSPRWGNRCSVMRRKTLTGCTDVFERWLGWLKHFTLISNFEKKSTYEKDPNCLWRTGYFMSLKAKFKSRLTYSLTALWMLNFSIKIRSTYVLYITSRWKTILAPFEPFFSSLAHFARNYPLKGMHLGTG